MSRCPAQLAAEVPDPELQVVFAGLSTVLSAVLTARAPASAGGANPGTEYALEHLSARPNPFYGQFRQLLAQLGAILRPLFVASVWCFALKGILSHVLREGAQRDVLAVVLLPAVTLAIFVFLLRQFDHAAAEDWSCLIQGIRRRIEGPRASST